MEKSLFFLCCRCLIFSTLLFPLQARAGGLIVNEASNGPSGAKEFIELIVVGSQASPTGAVDLNGWIIDDNNGDWGGGGSSVGTAPGYWRISTSSCPQFSAIRPGKIIIVYNAADPNPALSVDDESDSNSDGVYVIPSTSSCVRNCPGPPDSSSNGYSSCAVPSSSNWSSIALRNGGDVAQSRNASGVLFHGFSYGDVGAPFPSGSFNVDTSSGTGSVYVFTCGDWRVGSNFARQSSTTDSPGVSNNASNEIFRQKIVSGKFDYANPGSTTNCNALPSLIVSKTSRIIADGYNPTNPKAIPGSEIVYTIAISNNGPGTPDNNSIVIVDSLPATIQLFAGNYFAGAPVRFIDGPSSSGLNFTFSSLASTNDDVDFSNDNGVTYNYVPTPDASGYDSAVTSIRLRPKGVLSAASGGNTPSFAFELKAMVE